MTEEREVLTPDQAVAMLPDGDLVHTFMGGGFTLIGADWPRQKVVDAITAAGGAAVAGPGMTKMGHGIAAMSNSGWIFFETKKRKEADEKK